MKLLERDIYEINRKLDIVNTENCRFKVVSILKIKSARSQSELICSFPISEGATMEMLKHRHHTTGQTLSFKGMCESVFSLEGNKEEYPSAVHLPKAYCHVAAAFSEELQQKAFLPCEGG